MMQAPGLSDLGIIAPSSVLEVTLLAQVPADVLSGRTEVGNVTLAVGNGTLNVPYSLFIGAAGVQNSLTVLTVDQCAHDPQPTMHCIQ